MTAFASLPAVPPRAAARHRRARPVRWMQLLARRRRPRHDDALRAGDERPAPPMVMSVSLGGVGRLR